MPMFVVVQLLSRVQLFATPWTAPHQVSPSITNSQSLLKLMSIESEMSSNCLILYCLLVLLPSILPSIRVFSNESVLHIRWPKYYSLTLIQKVRICLPQLKIPHASTKDPACCKEQYCTAKD